MLDTRICLSEGLHGAPSAIGKATAAKTTVQCSHPFVGGRTRLIYWKDSIDAEDKYILVTKKMDPSLVWEVLLVYVLLSLVSE